eukprot:1766-Heterococcus_DN1.PRE.4
MHTCLRALSSSSISARCYGSSTDTAHMHSGVQEQLELDSTGSVCATHTLISNKPHSRPNIKNAVPKINTVARVFIDKLAQCTKGGKAYDCKEDCSLYALDSGFLVGAVEAAHDIQVMVKTLAYRILAPVSVWKLLPDRQFNAATKRFDALITGLIAQEKARLAAAGITDTSTATGTDADKVTDTSGVKGSCLLTQLVHYGAATKAAGAATTADKDSESSRYALTSEEVLIPLLVIMLLELLLVLQLERTDTLGGSLAWLLYELGAHQDVQQKLRDEITAYVTDHPSVGSDVTWDQVKHQLVALLIQHISNVQQCFRMHACFAYHVCYNASQLEVRKLVTVGKQWYCSVT